MSHSGRFKNRNHFREFAPEMFSKKIDVPDYFIPTQKFSTTHISIYLYYIYIYIYQLRFCTGSIGLMFFGKPPQTNETSPETRPATVRLVTKGCFKASEGKDLPHVAHPVGGKIEPIPILQGQKIAQKKSGVKLKSEFL